MQKLWLLELAWSDELPFKEEKEWRQFIDSLEAVNNISIDRCIVIHRAESIELHAFSDASEKAYGSSIYLKSLSALGEVEVCLVTSKSRVSPLKQISISRLELCGAVLADKFMKKVKEALNLQITGVHFWSDSTIVISWIDRESRELKPFVAIRVSKIHQLSSCDQFIESCKSKVKKRGPLTTNEVNDAETWLIKQDQSGINLSDPSGNLKSLNIFQDDKGVLRVGRRLEKAVIPYSRKHPAILAKISKLSKIYFITLHKKLFYVGPQELLNAVRLRLWALGGRNLARKTVHTCVVCFKCKPIPSSQMMGNLPYESVNMAPTFSITGLDLGGEENVPKIFTDNARNFVGVNSQLKAFYKTLNFPDQNLVAYFTEEGIEWNFIPPRAPHMGGLWEAGSKPGVMFEHAQWACSNRINERGLRVLRVCVGDQTSESRGITTVYTPISLGSEEWWGDIERVKPLFMVFPEQYYGLGCIFRKVRRGIIAVVFAYTSKHTSGGKDNPIVVHACRKRRPSIRANSSWGLYPETYHPGWGLNIGSTTPP
ncbi:integrase catalytic domain-containing protein [Trichonephila clavipes]|nr:integrase catalytic domain-containing protein [Trichonephila clavipes]